MIPNDIGERFALAVASKDVEALKALLASDVSFRALTPGRPWEGDDAATIVDDVILGTWFAPERVVTEVLRIDCDTVGTVGHVAYRFRAALPHGDCAIEQQAYFKVRDGEIHWLHILCSGFVEEG